MKDRDSEGGYVLVAVLGVMLVLSGLIASSSLVAHSVLRGARTDEAMDRLDALLRGGLEMTAYQIFTLKISPMSVNGRELRLDTGTVTAQVADEAGRIDVNGADLALLAGALRIVGLDAQTAAEVIGRVAAARMMPAPPPDLPQQSDGPSAAPRTTSPKGSVKPGASSRLGEPDGGGAVAQAPVTAPDPVGAQPRTGFRTVAEFLSFAGVDREDGVALSDLLTVMNPDGKLNVLTASRRALLALPSMSEVAADAIVAERGSALRSGLANLKGMLDQQKEYVKFEGGPCYRVHLASKDALGRAASRDAVIAAGSGPSDPFYILDWE